MESSKKSKRTLSIRTKIFLFMLAVSIIPTILITALAAYNTYDSLYKQLITINKDGMLWGSDRVSQFSDELKNTFYSMEFDKSFRNAVLKWGKDSDSYEDSALLRNTFNGTLNKNNLFSSIELYLVSDKSVIKAKRAGTTLQSDEEGFSNTFNRPAEMQTNMYLKLTSQGLYAVHNINTFEDRNLVAKLALQLRTGDMQRILEKLKTSQDERVYLLNDQNEIVMSINNGYDDQELLSKSIRLVNADSSKEYFSVDNNIIFYGQDKGGKLGIIKIIPRNEIVKATRPTVFAGIFMGIACVFAAIMLSALISFYISSPILKLTDKVKNIQMATLEIQTGEDTRNEISVLENNIALFVQRIKDLIHQEYVIKLQAKSAQIKALQAQINPHFLHNTLQLMGSMSLSKGVKEVYNIAGALSSMMRYSMDFESGFVTMGSELEHLDNYLLIQKERFYDKFSIELDIQEDVKNCLMPKLLLQPIVENCFQHGFDRSTGDWKLWIKAYLTEDKKVHITVRDNGSGMSREQVDALNERMMDTSYGSIKSSKHIGLLNVNSRIKLNFSENDGITVYSEKEEGTRIEYIFDAQKMEEANGLSGSDN